MPAFSTHYAFACETAQSLQNELDFKLNKQAYLMGAQGPDVFFFHRILCAVPGKSLRKQGSAIHREKPALIFESLGNAFKNSGAVAQSYIIGFITHYSLDRMCHPYVYSYQEKVLSDYPSLHPFSAHNVVELSMDSLVLAERFGIEHPECFDTCKTLSEDREILNECANALGTVSSEVLKANISRESCLQAFRDTKRLQSVLCDRHGIVKGALYAAESLAYPFSKGFRVSAMFREKDLEKAKKYANINNEFWRSPYDSLKRNESFLDLYELSKQDCRGLVCGFYKMLAGEMSADEVTENKGFLTGVEVK